MSLFLLLRSSLIDSSLLNIDNTPATNWVNPVPTDLRIIYIKENILVPEALRQINIEMNDSSNIYDGLETLWLGSADESLSSHQVTTPFLSIPSNLWKFLGYC